MLEEGESASFQEQIQPRFGNETAIQNAKTSQKELPVKTEDDI